MRIWLRSASVVVLCTMTIAATCTPRTALAAFSAAGAGSGSSGAQSIPASAAPIATAVGRNVTVSWQTTTLSGGTAAPQYVVRRYDAAGVLQTIGANCLTVTTTSCIENNVPYGTWRYSVQAKHGSWTGAISILGALTTVSVASYSRSSTAPIAALPVVDAGTIANFTVGETLSFRLDSPTGPILTGSPSTVTSSASMSVSITVPSGTSDAPHSIFVVGSTGTVASAALDIVIPPNLTALQMRDINANGKVDQVIAVFDDALGAYTAGTAPWTLANVPSGGTLSAVTVSGSTATLTIAEGGGAASTAVGTFTVALALNSAGVRDANDHLSAFPPTAPADLARPAPLALTAKDTNANGKVDQITTTFSEPLAAYSAPSSTWTLASVPSGGTLATVSVVSPAATLTITEGAGAADTAVGGFTVTLAANATGIRDAAGNLSSFTLTPIDGAAPIRLAQDMYDVNTDGKVDRVVVTFSETLAAYSAPMTVWSLASAPSSATLATVTVTGAAATLNLAQGAATATTAVGSFKIALSANAAGIRDLAGNMASYASTAPTDRAAPALVTLSLLDNSGNGKVDRLTAVFSETLSTYTAATAPWTLLNVPSGGSISSVTVATATATIVMTEGAGAADTTVGSMTVAMVASATGVRDAAGNLGSFAAATPLDKAKPAAVTVTDTNGTLDGRIESGDSVSITFSESLAAATVPTSTTLTMADPTGTGNDTLTLVGVSNGARTLGGSTYITTDATSAVFANSPVALSNGNRTITVIVGPVCSSTGCAGIGQRTTTASYSFVAATTLTDLAGNLAATQAKTTSIRMF